MYSYIYITYEIKTWILLWYSIIKLISFKFCKHRHMVLFFLLCRHPIRNLENFLTVLRNEIFTFKSIFELV